ncbi:MAG: hypothetical protein LBE84_00360 [Planctomycetota bacterium]|nr:hypothetical protein [Planctomycetota bacterium]
MDRTESGAQTPGECPLLVMDDIVKRFSGTVTVNHVGVTVCAGRVMALPGGNAPENPPSSKCWRGYVPRIPVPSCSRGAP